MKPLARPTRTCSADATAIQFADVLRSPDIGGSRGGGEHAQTVSVRIQRNEGMAEIQVDRALGDTQAATGPVLVELLNFVFAVDRERDFAAATERRAGLRLD